MISATEARKQMKELNTVKEKLQLEDVENAISKDIKKGYTYYYGKLTKTVTHKLLELGYNVEYYSSQRDGEITTIKW